MTARLVGPSRHSTDFRFVNQHNYFF